MQAHFRLARPVRDLNRTRDMYCQGLGLRVLGSFLDHQGFDGLMLGRADMHYHFEFTRCRFHPLAPVSTQEDLMVFYVPDLGQWLQQCEQMLAAGFKPASAFNPYWNVRGRSFEDLDGYRIVLQNAAWSNAEESPAGAS